MRTAATVAAFSAHTFARRGRGIFFAPRAATAYNSRTPMTLKLWMLAGGLLAFVATAIKMTRSRSKRFTVDQLSGDWLAQARAREEHQS